MSILRIALLALCVFPALVLANSIIADPIVECTEDSIKFTIQTASPFHGKIYVKNHFQRDSCIRSFSGESSSGTITIREGDCGMKRLRKFAGFVQSLVIQTVINPGMVVTKQDRIYNVACDYEYTQNVLKSDMMIGTLAPETLTKSVPVLPKCSYEIREGGINGRVVTEAMLGTTLVHVWSCNNPNHGILVSNCSVTGDDDFNNPPTAMLDARGCPTSNFPRFQVNYDQDLNTAYAITEAVRILDSTSQRLSCAIRICSKQDNGCLGFTPPNCPFMPRSEFRPDSRMNPDIAPTEVLATFQGQLRSNSIGETMIDGTISQPMGYENTNQILMNAPIPPGLEIAPWRKEQNSIDDAQPNEETDTQSNEQNDTTKYTQKASFAIHTTPSSAEDYQRRSNVYLRDDPNLEIIKKTTTVRPPTPVDAGRIRRLADDVMDVESELFINLPRKAAQTASTPTPPKDESSESVFSSIFSGSPEHLTCLNQWNVIAMGIAFLLTTFVLLGFIGYLWKELYKSCSSDRFENGSTCASTVSDRSTQNPWLSRRLGDRNYIRHFY